MTLVKYNPVNDEQLGRDIIYLLQQTPRIVMEDLQRPLERGYLAVPGVYLIEDSQGINYVGSTKNLRARARDHFRKLANASYDLTTTYFLPIESPYHVALMVEEFLIGNYTPAFQKTGFGSHAQGVNRQGQRPSKWQQRLNEGVPVA